MVDVQRGRANVPVDNENVQKIKYVRVVQEPTEIASVEPNGKLTWLLLLTVLVITLGTSFQFGYMLEALNNPREEIHNWYHETKARQSPPEYKRKMTEPELTWKWSIAACIFYFGGIFGGLCSGFFADNLGRQNTLLMNNIFIFMGSVSLTTAKWIFCTWMIPLGRLIFGFSCGLSSGLVSMYISEICPKNLRGVFGSFHQLVIVGAVVVAEVIGLPQVAGTKEYWPIVFAVPCIPAILQLIILPFCPKSPKHLVVYKKSEHKAESALRRLRNKDDVSEEMKVIKHEARLLHDMGEVKFLELFKRPLVWPTFLAAMMLGSQRLSGISIAFFYSEEVFKSAGLNRYGGDVPKFATLGMGLLNVLGTITNMFLVRRFGRKTLHIVGLSGMCFVTLALCLSITWMENTGCENSNSTASTTTRSCSASSHTAASVCTIASFCFYVLAFGIGPGCIPWIFINEVFPPNAHATAHIVVSAFAWTCNVFISGSFLIIKGHLKQYTFLIYTGITLFFALFTFFCIPETKGKCLEEIFPDYAEEATNKEVTAEEADIEE